MILDVYQTIFDFMHDQGRPVTCREIADALGLKVHSVTTRLQQMRQHKVALMNPRPSGTHQSTWEPARPAGAVIRIDISPGAAVPRRDFSARNRDQDRARIDDQVAEFLKRGGRIQKLPGPAEYQGGSPAYAIRRGGFGE